MANNLVIVESPAKAKTIEGFLGKDYIVKSSYGHVRDLAKKGISIDVKNQFEPNYEVMPDKKTIVSELKKLTKEAGIVWLATDEDREGEAISWHLFETLKLDDLKTKRIVFNEITKEAVQKAIQNPRKIDKNLVDAQQARRILDRLVGFELSPVLWKKVKPSLSAGRVQSVAVRLIVEREREIMEFVSKSSYRVMAYFNLNKNSFKAELGKRFDNQKEAEDFLEKCKKSNFTITSLEKKPTKKTPSAPFTTSTLQQEASRKLGFSVSQTMSVAQKLYESGKITYMRTDSVNLSETATNAAEQEIIRSFGKEYHQFRSFKTKSKGAQEAHEAIRPTYMNQHSVDGDRQAQRLYDMIWKRTLASQMGDAILEKTTAIIDVSNAEEQFVARGEVIKFDGFLKVYIESTDDDSEEKENEGMLPPLAKGDKLNVESIVATEKYTHHPARYTEASLVKKLEELGIGRPSTYAPTISTIQKRNYVLKEDREGHERKYQSLTLKEDNIKIETKTEITGAEKSKLFPTDMGMVVTDFLKEHFKEIMDYSFTAKVEKEFDEIAEGNIKWRTMLEDFYLPFHNTVEDTLENSERASGERILGEDPVSKKPVVVRMAKFGPVVQIGSPDDDEKPRFAGLRTGQMMETIELHEALELFRLPRNLGEFEGKEIQANIGRFGPYVKYNSLFVSIPKEIDPLEITLEKAIELIENKREQEKNRLIKSFDEDKDLQVLNGRFGPYISLGKKNFKIPKDLKPEELSFEKCMEIINSTPDKPAGAKRKFVPKGKNSKK
jgi:DNA topoisomerase I